jgi:hypothetical protein
MIDISGECLRSEFKAAKPAMILITEFAQRLLPYVKAALSASDTRLDEIINHPMKIVVPFWSRPPHDEWVNRVLTKIAAQLEGLRGD